METNFQKGRDLLCTNLLQGQTRAVCSCVIDSQIKACGQSLLSHCFTFSSPGQVSGEEFWPAAALPQLTGELFKSGLVPAMGQYPPALRSKSLGKRPPQPFACPGN